MLGLRDVVWSVVICGALTLMFQCRPAWSARSTVERDAFDGFLAAYKGHRDIDGDVIAPKGQGAYVDPLASEVSRRSFEITAERISWTGGKAELVARHSVELVASPPATDTVEVHVTLERRGNRWAYTSFEVRDGPAITDLDSDNPWIRALAKGSAEPPQPGEG